MWVINSNGDSDGIGGDGWRDDNSNGRRDGNAMATTTTAMGGATAKGMETMVGKTATRMEGVTTKRRQWR